MFLEINDQCKKASGNISIDHDTTTPRPGSTLPPLRKQKGNCGLYSSFSSKRSVQATAKISLPHCEINMPFLKVKGTRFRCVEKNPVIVALYSVSSENVTITGMWTRTKYTENDEQISYITDSWKKRARIAGKYLSSYATRPCLLEELLLNDYYDYSPLSRMEPIAFRADSFFHLCSLLLFVLMLPIIKRWRTHC